MSTSNVTGTQEEQRQTAQAVKNHINVEGLSTIGDLLVALSSINQSIDDIDIQLALGKDRDADWRFRADIAKKKCGKVRRSICDKLAILRQQEKELMEAARQQGNELLVDEMKRYLPRAVFLACVHRARLKEQQFTQSRSQQATVKESTGAATDGE
ncbi:hypothetical protein KU75_21890 [Pectobacterium odoriferum]|uniref:Uncharacterized protein n=1 Tax=Pectobacterium odoriferum TaxID=78398 RepID=A0ABR4VJR8_9GAMM|nr:hypothetical protein [Pectobacterium odoriferum]KGA39563.1 hypothetical protein KU75_21890 [Pectobacterium odoriferum]